MIGFLRMFADFRDIEARNAELEVKKDHLMDQRAALLGQLADAMARIDTAHRSEIEATRSFTDFVAIGRTGRPVFNLASQVPVQPDLKEIPTQKPQQSAIQQQLEREFFAQYNAPPKPEATQ